MAHEQREEGVAQAPAESSGGIPDRAEMDHWICRALGTALPLAGFTCCLCWYCLLPGRLLLAGDLVLLEDQFVESPTTQCQEPPPHSSSGHSLSTFYLAGVEGVGHHGALFIAMRELRDSDGAGVMPVVLRALCARHGFESTLVW